MDQRGDLNFVRWPPAPVKKPNSTIKWEYSIKKREERPLAEIIYDDTEWMEFPENFSSSMESSFVTTKQLIESTTYFAEPVDNGLHDLSYMMAKMFGHARPLHLVINVAGMIVSNYNTGEIRWIRRRERLAEKSLDDLIMHEIGVQVERIKKALQKPT
jgi:hypothetical protein